jgi:hypothetical protein
MQVEIYDEREIDPQTLKRECDEEAIALIKELGLTAQMSSSESETRQCYPQPTADQGFTMEVLFPMATRLEKYDAGTLPLRVLKEIRSYRAEHPDHDLVVRHAAPAALKDPVLVAYAGSDHHDYYVLQDPPTWRNYRLIARWGDALEAWDKLLDRAKDAATKSYENALVDIISKCEAAMATIAKGVKVKNSRLPRLELSRDNDSQPPF